MKDTRNDIDYLAILEENTKRELDTSLVREEVLPYLSSKQQGEYTLDDYYAIPDDYRVELIDGVIYDMTSAPTLVHQMLCAEIGNRLYNYIKDRKGKCIAFWSPVDVQLDCDDRTMLQPDVSVTCNRDKLNKRNVYGAPDFVAEILSPSTRRKDMTIKKEKYKKAGVREYWMVDGDNERVVVHRFEEGDIVNVYTFDDVISVGIFNGDCMIDFMEISERVAFLKV